MTHKEGIVKEEIKWKVGWTVGLILMGWVFMLFVPTENGEPISDGHWRIWVVINVVAIVRVHFWLTEDDRAIRRAMYNRRRHHPK